MASLLFKAESVGIEKDVKYFEITKQRLDKRLFENPAEKSKIRCIPNGRTKKDIQIKVATAIENNPELISLTIKEKVDWLIRHQIIDALEVKIFSNLSQFFRAVGKDGVLLKGKKDKEREKNHMKSITLLDFT
ncbi:MAG: hypothetical protein EU532_13290 [Promethearchaeota archaeon]|nr:MAG: hypothetical protein EU532_13290 [Candidatus Lokiarchaeota archaeon]